MSALSAPDVYARLRREGQVLLSAELGHAYQTTLAAQIRRLAAADGLFLRQQREHVKNHSRRHYRALSLALVTDIETGLIARPDGEQHSV